MKAPALSGAAGIVALALLALLALPLLWGAAVRMLALLRYPYPQDGLEGTLLHEARLLWAGEPLYQPLERGRFVSAPYPPLHPLLLGFANQFAGPHVFWSGRLLSLVAALSVAALIVLIVRRAGGTWLGGLLGTSIFLSAPPVLLWSTRVKPDLTALLWTALGLWFAQRSLALTSDEGRRTKDERQRWFFVRPLALWAALAAATVFALWPALWASPLQAYAQLQVGVAIEGAQPHMLGNFFLGREDDAPGMLFYPLALVLRLTPWTLLGLLLLPIAWHRMRALAPARRDLALLALYVIVFVAAMSVFPKKFNRYIEPVFPALDILAAVGLLGVGGWGLGVGRLLGRESPIAGRPALSLSKGRSSVAIGLVGTITVVAIANIAFWHPYEIAAYNQALGGARAGAHAFLTGWGEGLEQAADWLNQQPDITGVRVATTQPGALQPYMRDGAQAVAASDQLPDHTGYLVVYVRSTQGLV
nr:hypothetical protein [Chloroflexota bacterium]